MMVNVKLLLIIVQLTCTILFSGILFGWAPFELLMISEGLYSCQSSNNQENDENKDCDSQNSKLKMLYTLATSTFMIFSLFVGLFVDHYGPTKTTILVTFLFFFSFFLLTTQFIDMTEWNRCHNFTLFHWGVSSRV